MEFTCTVDINAPIEKVVELFENPDNLHEWQDGYRSFEHMSGTEGAIGAKSKLIYDRLELIETIIRNELPHEFKATYEHKHMVNTMSCRFSELDTEKTRLEQEIHYTKFNGFMIKLMAKLFPRMFKKQVQKWLNQFKAFVERENS